MRLRRARQLPEEWGGGINKWPWAIPLIATNVATKPELVGHFAPEAPDFNLLIPDQISVEIFLRHLKQWVADRESGRDTMPNFVMLRLPNDHTYGTRPGGPSPKSSVADNDFAVGRAVEAISHSPYWDDTAFFILEDDAQAGADHVDAHRSIALVISKYSPHGPAAALFRRHAVCRQPLLLHRERHPHHGGAAGSAADEQQRRLLLLDLLAVYRARRSAAVHRGLLQPRQRPDLYSEPKNAVGARASMKMDFSHEDRAPTEKLNVILWKDAMGAAPVPPMLKVRTKKTGDSDDD